ncbi:MAG TPA: hypothetical protein VMS60_00375 [Solirubrobacterales bacterium]|nr:hypothetical protein [Solirubrobacterales bacterium]
MEMLPRGVRAGCPGGLAPAALIEEIANSVGAQTVGDLVLELTIALTNGDFADHVDIDASAVELVPASLNRQMSEGAQWARLALDLSHPDWTVVVSLRALPEHAPEPEESTEGVLSILVRPGLDFRGWLAEKPTRAMIHKWYLQYQLSGVLNSERQLAELHEELSWVEERGRFVFASQLTPEDPAEETWQLQEIRSAGGARTWARQLWERSDRPAILAANGSWEREDVVGELATRAERLLVRAAER